MEPSFRFTAYDLNFQDIPNPVYVDELGNATLSVSFNERGYITGLEFKNRPDFSITLSLDPDMEVCHKISIAWIKALVERNVIDKNLIMLNQAVINQRKKIVQRLGMERIPPDLPSGEGDPMEQHYEKEFYQHELQKCSQNIYEILLPGEHMGFFFPPQDPALLDRFRQAADKREQCRQTTRAVAAFFVNYCQVQSNMMIGDKKHNRFAGALSLYLQTYVRKGKDQAFPFEIDFSSSDIFHKIVRAYLRADRLEIQSFEMLMDLYFACNYDESNLNGPNPACQSAMKLFLHTYRLDE